MVTKERHECPICETEQIVFWDKTWHFECTNPNCPMYQRPYGNIG